MYSYFFLTFSLLYSFSFNPFLIYSFIFFFHIHSCTHSLFPLNSSIHSLFSCELRTMSAEVTHVWCMCVCNTQLLQWRSSSWSLSRGTSALTSGSRSAPRRSGCLWRRRQSGFPSEIFSPAGRGGSERRTQSAADSPTACRQTHIILHHIPFQLQHLLP